MTTSTSEQSNIFKVLSLSGGGFRGLYTANVLSNLEKFLQDRDQHNESIANYFDLITGTSVGGIISLALAHEIPMNEVVKLFESNGETIFKRQACVGFTKAKYSSDLLKETLIKWFSDNVLEDLKHPVVIPAIDYSTGKPVTFKTPHHPSLVNDRKIKIVDIALATSAAPTFFKRHTINSNEYVDGGLFANNPSLIGLHEAEIFFKKNLKDIHVLSIGTLSSKKTLNPKTNKKGGLLDWGEGYITKASTNIIELVLSSQQMFTEQIVKHRIGNNLVTIDENITHSSAQYIGLDQTTKEAIQVLKANSDSSSKQAKGKEEVLLFFKNKTSNPPW